MPLNIFNPKLCLADHLKHSWSMGVHGAMEGKLPIETVEGIPRLKIMQDPYSEESWCCGVVPFNQAWDCVNLNKYNFLNFNFYGEDSLSCRVGFKDKEENDSSEIEIFSIPNVCEGELCAVSIPLYHFEGNNFNPKEARLFKMVGYNNSAFYLSQLSLSREAVV